MKKIDFLDAVGKVSDKHVDECLSYRPGKNRIVKQLALIAACFVCIFAIGATAWTVYRGKQTTEIDGFVIKGDTLIAYNGSETEVNIPEQVKKIADFTFMNNENADTITVVRLGSSVQTVETNAFAGLTGLVDMMIAENNLSFVRESGAVITSDGSIILFYDGEGTHYTVPDTVRIIGAHAFQNTTLTSIDLSQVEMIGYNAFASGSLTAVYLPDTITYLEEGAFAHCVDAVDGYIPAHLSREMTDAAFPVVPFYLTKLAGSVSPLEDIRRNNITPSEAIRKSDLEGLSRQLDYLFAHLRGEGYPMDEVTGLANGAVVGMDEIPADFTAPQTVNFADITYFDTGWRTTGIYDVQIRVDCGNYTLMIHSYAYNTGTALYWEDVFFRLASVTFIPEDADAEVTSHGWTATWEEIVGDPYPTYDEERGVWNDRYCTDLVFTHEDGRIIPTRNNTISFAPYELIFSPDGSRCIVQHKDDYNGQWHFYVHALNGDKIQNGVDTYQFYDNRYFTPYIHGTLSWIDNDHVAGQNQNGGFVLDIYSATPRQTEEVTSHGWTVTWETEKDESQVESYYTNILFTHEDGRVIAASHPTVSWVPYVLIFSPDGTRCIVQYKDGFEGRWHFYVQCLNDDLTQRGMDNYQLYVISPFTPYVYGSLRWIDEDNVAGQNQNGAFVFNVYDPTPYRTKDVTPHGWTATWEIKDNGPQVAPSYTNILFTHEDGRIVTTRNRTTSWAPYELIFSPDGTRCIVQYRDYTDGVWHFYVQCLNEDLIQSGVDNYQLYYNRYFTPYEYGSLSWIDEDNVAGRNRNGAFVFNIYDPTPRQVEDGETGYVAK